MSDLIKEKYLRYADRCVTAANMAASAEERLQYLEMAQAWRTLADKAQVVDMLLSEARENHIIPNKSEMN
jgi:hypothetical protein